MELPLEGRTAIVTGAGRGIGRGIALCLAQDGADVAVVDWIGENARAVAAEVEVLGRRALAFEADVSQTAPVRAMVSAVLARWGKIDILVNNAGVIGAAGWPEHPTPRDEDWEAVYRVNLRSRVICSEAVMAHMKERRSGKIINIASIGGLHGATAIPHYCASKAADIHYTRSLALQLAPYNINVNAICPGLLLTDMYRGLAELSARRNPALAGQDVAARYQAAVERVMPLRRGQEPEDVGWMAAFLASDLARNITAQAINVDGGEVLH